MKNHLLKVKQALIIIAAFLLLVLSTEILYLHIIAPLYGYHYWASQLIYSIIFALFIAFLFKIFNLKLTNSIVKPKPSEVILIVGIAIMSLITFLVFCFPRAYINSLFFSQENINLYANNNTFPQNLQYLIFGCVLSPILEEIFWREILLRKLIQHYNQTKVIIILSVVFGVLHFKYSFAALILLSIIASYIYIKSNSLVLAILFHSLWNSFDLIFSFFREQLSSVLISFWYIPIFFTGGIIIWLLLKKFVALQGDNTIFKISKKDISQ